MKDSGVEWLGEVPAHWDVLPTRRVARTVTTGRTPPASAGDYFSDGTVPWFTPGDFNSSITLRGSEKSLTEDAFVDGVAVKYPKGSVLLVGIGATLGKVAVAEVACSSNQQINAIVPSSGNDPYFLAAFLQAFRAEVRIVASGNTLPILNQEKTKSIIVTCPPQREQKEISAYISCQDIQIEIIAAQIQKSIDLLAESRSALITAAVSGNIETLR